MLESGPKDVLGGDYKFIAARPETLSLSRPGEPGIAKVTVETVMFSGSTVEFTVLLESGRRLSGVATPATAWMRPGDEAVLVISTPSLTLLKD